MIKLIQAIMFVKEQKRQAVKYFTNFTKVDLNIYLKIKCQDRYGVLFTQKNWEVICNV